MIKQLRSYKYPNARKLVVMDDKGLECLTTFVLDEFIKKFKES